MAFNPFMQLVVLVMGASCLAWVKFEPDPEKKIHIFLLGIVTATLAMVWPGWWWAS